MANPPPTVKSLDARLGGVEKHLGTVAATLDRVSTDVSELGNDNRAQYERLLEALGAFHGMDEVGAGLASIAEVLGPIRHFAPPTNATALDDGVPEALGEIRAALGGDNRELNFTVVPTAWDGPVGFIGQPRRRNDPGPYGGPS